MLIKNIILILLSVIISYIQAAEKPLRKRPKCNTGPCYFAMIDRPLLDLIAQYLTFADIEYEEDFIKRTQNILKKEIPSQYYYDAHSVCTENMLTAFCPNEVYAILLDSNLLKIVNTKNDLLVRKIILYRDVKKKYKHVALSRNATIFATIEKDEELDPKSFYTEIVSYINATYLTIQNLHSQQKERIKLSQHFKTVLEENSCISLAFNKQGTHIILHGIDYTQPNALSANGIHTDSMQPYQIFPVTVNEPNAIIQPKKTLQHYFQQKGICKNITGILNT